MDMEKLFESSVNALPWVMVILAGLVFISMIIMLYHQRQHHHKLNRKE